MSDNNTIIKKLKLDNYNKKLMVNKPMDVSELDDIDFDKKVKEKNYDLIITFVFNLDEMEEKLLEVSSKNLLNDGGYLYFAYPKKGNKKYKDCIERDSILPRFGINEEDGFFGDTNLKFSKMLSLNDVFTMVGLKKFLKRPVKKQGASNCVNDYIEKIPKIREYFENRESVLVLYDGLTYGYQKDWARYVYSAKTEATKEKRFLEMAEILLEGYKSKDLYRQSRR